MRIIRDARGVSATEYAVLLALVMLVAVGAWQLLGATLSRDVDCAARAIGALGAPCGVTASAADRSRSPASAAGSRASLTSGSGATASASDSSAALTALGSRDSSTVGEPVEARLPPTTSDASRGQVANDDGDDGCGSMWNPLHWGCGVASAAHAVYDVSGLDTAVDRVADGARWVWNTPVVRFGRGLTLGAAGELYSIARGVLKFQWDAYRGAAWVVTHPGDAFDAVRAAFSHPGDTLSAAWHGALHVGERLLASLSEDFMRIFDWSLPAEQRGRALGRTGVLVAGAVLTDGAALPAVATATAIGEIEYRGLPSTRSFGDRARAFVRGDGDARAIDPSDVRQGHIGDCYLMAALAAIATRDPGALRALVHRQPDGTYTVTLHTENGATRTFPIDPEFEFWGPYLRDARLGDETSRRSELWPMLFEKAYADANGGREEIADGGSGGVAMAALTGRRTLLLGEPMRRFSFEGVADRWDAGDAITASTISDDAPSDLFQRDGWLTQVIGNAFHEGKLVRNHEYYVTGIDRANQTITVHNPWGGDGGGVTLDWNDFQRAFWGVYANPIR